MPEVDWAHPSFSDPRFTIEAVWPQQRCRHEGCDRIAEHTVEYTMRREGWTYEYECGYCDEHLPAEARAAVARMPDESAPHVHSPTLDTASGTLCEVCAHLSGLYFWPDGTPHERDGSCCGLVGGERRE